GSRRDDLQSLETNLTRLERFAHFWVLVVQSFVRNRCPVRASALSYTTLLALVPMLAVAMSVTTIFLKAEGREKIETFIQQFIENLVPDAPTNRVAELWLQTNRVFATAPAPAPPAPTTLDTNAVAVVEGEWQGPELSPEQIRATLDVLGKQRAAAQIYRFIENTYSGALGVTGVVFLLWMAIIMLARIEETFNDIWGVARGRNWLSRIVLYWTTITLGPLLLIGALGLASGPHFEKTRALLDAVPMLRPVISQLLPLAIICITFTLFYKLMPNTRVNFSAALVGGALAGTTWHLFNQLSFYLGTRAITASKIYGSLALIPLLMFGLYAVWLIVLFGAQTAYAFQNREAYLQERLAENVNQRGREFIALRLMTTIGQRFAQGLPPPTVRELSRELGIPSKLIHQVLQTLLAARLVVEVAGPETGFAPARPLETINCHHILLAMRATHGQELPTREEPLREELLGEFARIQAAERDAASRVTMLDLVARTRATLPEGSTRPASSAQLASGHATARAAVAASATATLAAAQAREPAAEAEVTSVPAASPGGSPAPPPGERNLADAPAVQVAQAGTAGDLSEEGPGFPL
ncbi:MAG: YhjD/YihY/BrkB family envelope integrity protein, partial [Verrucomicrobiales bacterium]|nr:YhjD/YihY/BrkB family envelope integrity protein [Verrucomicrobiales bacterium]